jgi:hypothetical protein
MKTTPSPAERRHAAQTALHDLLDAGTGPKVDDALPAWCECGPRVLSRAELQDALAQHQRQLLVT